MDDESSPHPACSIADQSSERACKMERCIHHLSISQSDTLLPIKLRPRRSHLCGCLFMDDSLPIASSLTGQRGERCARNEESASLNSPLIYHVCWGEQPWFIRSGTSTSALGSAKCQLRKQQPRFLSWGVKMLSKTCELVSRAEQMKTASLHVV